ncbi:MAG: hypothetical protein J0H49_29270 [Acidobacteria bacterium]|nr:hypothetical protein [Acidobacteriota bacterium]
MAELPEGREAGEQESVLGTGRAVTVREAVLVVPLAVAVTATAVLVVTEAAVTVKVPEVAPAATVMEAGVVSAVLLSERVTCWPPAGAATERVTVQVAELPEGREAGEHERVLGMSGAVTVTEAVLEVPLAAAVMTTAVLEVTEAAVAEKEAEVAPAGTVTEAGMVRAALLSERVTNWPPVGAAPESVTVQEEDPPELMEAGEHESELGTGRAVTVTVEVLEVPLAVAVTTTAVLAVTEAAVTEKAAEVAPPATVTEAGVERAALLSERVTSCPPMGAAAERVTVQVAVLPEEMEAGKQVRVLGAGRAVSVREAVLDVPFAVAVMTANVLVRIEVAVTEKVAEVAPAGTVTEAGVERAALLSARVTSCPPAGAAAERVTVQVAEPPERMEVREQVSDDTATGVVAAMEMVPSVASAVRKSPVGEDAKTWGAVSRRVGAVEFASVRLTLATVPTGIAVEFAPTSRQV